MKIWWIAAAFALAAWAVMALLYYRQYQVSNQQQWFFTHEKEVGTELEAARATRDLAVIDACLGRLARKWNCIDWITLQHAEFLAEQDRPQEAIRLLKSYIRRARRFGGEVDRGAPIETMVLARILAHNGRSDEAERLVQKGLKFQFAHPGLAALSAEIAMRRGDSDLALIRFADAVERFPEDVGLTERFAKELIAAGRTEEAEAELQAGLLRMERGQELAVLFAQIAHDRGDWEEAAKRWEAVYQNFVFFKPAYENGAAALRELGREAEAEAVLASRPRPIGELTD